MDLETDRVPLRSRSLQPRPPLARWLVLAVALAALPIAARSDGGFSCRWESGTTAVAYAAFDAQAALATDVRLMMQGAVLVEPVGRFPRFAALTPSNSARRTEPLQCQADQAVSDGMLELTFSRRVRLGIEYTLGKCQLFYRCGPPGAGTEPAALQPYLSFVPHGVPIATPAEPAPDAGE